MEITAIIFMTTAFVRVLVFCKLKLTRHSLGAVVVMKSGAIFFSIASRIPASPARTA